MAFLFLNGDAQALSGLVKTPRHAKITELSKKSGDCSKHPSSNMSNVDRFKTFQNLAFSVAYLVGADPWPREFWL